MDIAGNHWTVTTRDAWVCKVCIKLYIKANENGTKKIAKAICDATENGAFSLIGGGDSVAAIKKFGLANKASYISTGGGAMLEYLEGKKLPGIEAILT